MCAGTWLALMSCLVLLRRVAALWAMGGAEGGVLVGVNMAWEELLLYVDLLGAAGGAGGGGGSWALVWSGWCCSFMWMLLRACMALGSSS